MDVQLLLLTVQEHFQKELVANLEIFQVDCEKFVKDYNTCGPMQPKLSPREASDRLQMFQNHFDALWRKHNSYSIGEDLFGLPHSEQPELNRIKKELNLLQRLYKLYNDVIDSVNGYHNIHWTVCLILLQWRKFYHCHYAVAMCHCSVAPVNRCKRHCCVNDVNDACLSVCIRSGV